MPSSIVSFTTPTASNSPAKACVGPEQSNRERLDQTPQPVTKLHRPARLVIRAASIRAGGRHHSGIPGAIIPLHPGGFVGIGNQAIGRSRGGLTTKIHVIVDALGNPLALSLTGGNAHDITQAEPLAAQVEPEALLGDKGYDTDSFINSLEVRAIKAVIPPRSTRKVKRACDFALSAERNLVERFFNTIKHYRGIATRYEKTARNFLAGLHLVCALAWLK